MSCCLRINARQSNVLLFGFFTLATGIAVNDEGSVRKRCHGNERGKWILFGGDAHRRTDLTFLDLQFATFTLPQLGFIQSAGNDATLRLAQEIKAFIPCDAYNQHLNIPVKKRHATGHNSHRHRVFT